MKRKLNGPAIMRRLESLRWYRWGTRPGASDGADG